MKKIFLQDIDMSGNKLTQACLEPLVKAPLFNLLNGRVYYDTVLKCIQVYDEELDTWINTKVTVNGISPVDGNIQLNKQISMNSTDTTVMLNPDTLYVWDEVTSLTLDFNKAGNKSDTQYYYAFQFKTGNIPTTLSLPSDLHWVSSKAIEANRVYLGIMINDLIILVSAS